ncbi:hypothetical protein BGZ74_011547 [Mortierella antarctica]|nr:hypothetical protein BGZ74_011547 [Mortierella antarctica]
MSDDKVIMAEDTPSSSGRTSSTDHPKAGSYASTTPTPTVPRRATFSAATDFRPHSHCNTKTCTPEAPCSPHAQTKSQRQFAKCFPELAELYPTSPSTSTRSSCLTPPHTPPDFSSPSTFVPSLQANLDFAHDNDSLEQHSQTVRRLRKHIHASEETLLGSDIKSTHSSDSSIPTLILDHDSNISYPDQPTRRHRSSFDGSTASTDSSERGEGSDSLSSLTPRTSWKMDARSWTRSEGSRQRRPSADSEVESIAYSFTKTLVAPIAIQPSSSKAPSIRSQSFKSPTPPPSLLSPSLTTTKISKSSSTVQSNRGPSQGMTVHVRNESHSRILETAEEVEEPHSNTFTGLMERSASHQGLMRNKAALFDTIASRNTIPIITTPPIQEPTSPIACGCSRHYKHAILSTIVPLSVAACFEVLFSGCGTGSGDVLFKDAHRTKDGSTGFKLSAWNDDSNTLGHLWEGKKRQTEYSVAFKVPLAKTSAACFETLEITHYSDHAILVHSETKTPNVPYGEQFSTVHQICLTWDSPGNTRIKCFAEVKFAKKILLANKLEASLLESSSEYYREFIRRLVDYAESLEEGPMVRPAGSCASLPSSLKIPLSDSQVTMVSPLPSPIEQPSPCQSGTSERNTSGDQAVNGTFTSSMPGTTEMSPALSLLSQQHLRHPPSHKSGARASMDNLRPASAPALPSVDLKQRAATMDKKSALSFIQNMLKAPTLPDVAPPVLKSKDPKEEKPSKEEKSSKEDKSEKDSAAVALWTDIKKISLAIFTKDSKDKATPDKDASKDTFAQSTIGDTTKPAADDKAKVAEEVGYNVSPIIPVKPVAVPPAVVPTKSPFQSISVRATFALFVFVLAASVMNMWYMFGVVSSVVQVVQEKHDVSSSASFVAFSKFDPSMASYPARSSESLAPIQTQTEMLRAEIKELLSMLEQARELGQRS